MNKDIDPFLWRLTATLSLNDFFLFVVVFSSNRHLLQHRTKAKSTFHSSNVVFTCWHEKSNAFNFCACIYLKKRGGVVFFFKVTICSEVTLSSVIILLFFLWNFAVELFSPDILTHRSTRSAAEFCTCWLVALARWKFSLTLLVTPVLFLPALTSQNVHSEKTQYG